MTTQQTDGVALSETPANPSIGPAPHQPTGLPIMRRGRTMSRSGPRAEDEVDAQMVVYRLEEAGRTLLSLPPSGYSTRLRTSSIDLLRSALDPEVCGPSAIAPGQQAPLRPPVPSASRITRMDEAFEWVVLIPRDRYVIRRIVGSRALVSPLTERHLFSWRRIGTLLGADHKAIQRWHAQGIDMIVAAVNAQRCQPVVGQAPSSGSARRPDCPHLSRLS